MAAEELNKPAASPAPSNQSETNVGNGDMAHLIGNVGSLIDSTIISVQGAISSVSATTEQIIEGVSSTINSEPVQLVINSVSSVAEQVIQSVTAIVNPESIQGVFNSVSSATGQLIDGVSSTINSQPVQEIFNNVSSGAGQLLDGVTSTINYGLSQSSFQELGKLWRGLLENLNAGGSVDQVQNLFNNISAGLGQLLNSSFMPGASGGRENRGKKDVVEIRFTPKEVASVPVREVVVQTQAAPVQQSAPKEILVAPVAATAPKPNVTISYHQTPKR
jgi:chlorosome envelope protein H